MTRRRPWLRAALVAVAVVVAVAAALAAATGQWSALGGVIVAIGGIFAALRRPAPRRDGAVRRVTLPPLPTEPSPEAAEIEALAVAEHAAAVAEIDLALAAEDAVARNRRLAELLNAEAERRQAARREGAER